MIGPAIGGLLGSTSITLPFFVTAGITLLSAILTAANVPESLPPEKRTTHLSLQSLNTFAHFNEVFFLKEARALLIMGAFFYIGLNIWQFNATIFLKDVFAWGPSLIGGVFVLVGICGHPLPRRPPAQLLKNMERAHGRHHRPHRTGAGHRAPLDERTLPLADPDHRRRRLHRPGRRLFDPSYNARLSLSVAENKQGQLQGANQGLQALYRVLVPLGAAAIYTYSHGRRLRGSPRFFCLSRWGCLCS